MGECCCRQSGRNGTLGRRRPGFTFVELLMVMLIMAIVASLGFDAISSYDAAARPERAARECVMAFRYARHLAMSTGKKTRVSFDVANKTFGVYWMSNGTTWDASPVAQALAQGGVYSVRMANAPELKGVSVAVSPSGVSDFTFNPLGSLDTAATVTFSYGTKSKVLTVSKVGDPAIN